MVDFDEDIQSDHDPQDNILDDNLDDDGWDQRQRERSPTPVYDDDYKSKPRKRLIKKSDGKETATDLGFADEDVYDDGMAGMVRDESDGGGPSYSGGGKRKRFEKESSGEKRKEKKREKGEKKFKLRKNGGYSGSGSRGNEGDQELKELWDTVAGGDSEVCGSLIYVPSSIILFLATKYDMNFWYLSFVFDGFIL